MKQKIPFTKDITFKTQIKDLTSISLDNDLTLKGEDLIVGSFYIKGTYKNEDDVEEEYSYRVPCEIAISDDYDTYESSIDIDDFRYEIINNEVLRVDIVVLLDNLIKKERCYDLEELEEIQHEIKLEQKEEKEEKEERINVITDKEENIIKLDKQENYLTYRVYLVKEEDTIDKILTKYKVTYENLKDYNDLDNFTTGIKLIIPSSDND